MKKNILKYGYFAVCATALVACSDEAMFTEPVTKPATQFKDGINFYAESFIDEDGTRVDYNFSEEGVSVSFNEEDVIGVWGMRDDQLEQVAFRLSDAATSEMSAHFDGGLWRLREGDGTKYAALYPWRSNANDYIGYFENNKKCPIVNYNSQEYNAAEPTYSSLGRYDYMACGPMEVVDGTVNFKMEHLGAMVRLSLDGLLPNLSVESVNVSRPDYSLWYDAWVDLSAEKPSFIYSNSSVRSYTVWTYNLNTDANGHADVYMMMPPMDLSNTELTISVNASVLAYSATVTGKNIQAGHRYKLEASEFECTSTPLVLGENTNFDHSGSDYYFIPEESGLYTFEMYDGWYDVYNVSFSLDGAYYLEAGTAYKVYVNRYSSESVLTISYTTLESIELGTPKQVTANTWYSVDIEEGLYSFNSEEPLELYLRIPDWGSTRFYTPYTRWIYNSGTAFIRPSADAVITVSDAAVGEIVVGTETTINAYDENGNRCYYKVEIPEDGYYQLENEVNGGYLSFYNNGSMTNSRGLPLTKGTYYAYFYTSYSDVTTATVKIKSVEIVDLSEGTTQVNPDLVYRFTVAEDGYYKVSSNCDISGYWDWYCENEEYMILKFYANNPVIIKPYYEGEFTIEKPELVALTEGTTRSQNGVVYTYSPAADNAIVEISRNCSWGGGHNRVAYTSDYYYMEMDSGWTLFIIGNGEDFSLNTISSIDDIPTEGEINVGDQVEKVEGKIYKLNIPADGYYRATREDGNYWDWDVFVYRQNCGSGFIDTYDGRYLPEGSYFLSTDYSGKITINAY